MQIFLKHSITNTFPFSRRFQYYGYKTIAQIAPESFPFFFPPAVLALESQTFCFGEIQWFVSRVSTKHIEGGVCGKILSMFANGHTKNDAFLVVLQASTMYALNGLKSIAATSWRSVSVVKIN